MLGRSPRRRPTTRARRRVLWQRTAILVALGLLLFFDRFWWIRIGFNRMFEFFGVGV